MRKFNIKVNGTSYEVEIEEIGAVGSATVTDNAPIVKKPAEPVVKAQKPAPVVSGNGTKVLSPMPGTVLSIKVKTGDTVKKGQPIIVLEAMKMENEIVAPCDGTITIHTSVGANIESGELIAVLG